MTFCDYDEPTAPHLRPMYVVARLCGLVPKWVEYYRTRRGWHVTIQWSRKLEPLAIVALQAVLGSDPRRESLNLMRVLNKADIKHGGKQNKWNLLYSRKLK